MTSRSVFERSNSSIFQVCQLSQSKRRLVVQSLLDATTQLDNAFPVAPDPKLCLAGSNSEFQEQTSAVSELIAREEPPDAQPSADKRPRGSSHSDEPTAPRNCVHVRIRTTSQEIPGDSLDASDFPHIQQTLNLILLLTVKHHRRRRRLLSPLIRISLERLQERHMKYRMDTHACRQFQPVGNSINLVLHRKGPNHLGINFLAPAGAFLSFRFLELNNT
jgi:hypothetical protein